MKYFFLYIYAQKYYKVKVGFSWFIRKWRVNLYTFVFVPFGKQSTATYYKPLLLCHEEVY